MAEAGIPVPSSWRRITYFHCSLLGYFLGLLTATVSSEVGFKHLILIRASFSILFSPYFSFFSVQTPFFSALTAMIDRDCGLFFPLSTAFPPKFAEKTLRAAATQLFNYVCACTFLRIFYGQFLRSFPPRHC